MNVTVPPVVVVIVPLAVIALVVSPTPVAPSVFTAPVSSVVPPPADCVRLLAVTPADSVTLFAFVITMSPRRVAPTTPVNTTFPPVPAFTVRCSTSVVVPVNAPLKVTLAPAALPLVVSMLVTPAPLKVTPVAKLTASPVVVIVRGELMLVTPAPF